MRRISVFFLVMSLLAMLYGVAISVIVIEQPQLPSEVLNCPVHLKGDVIGEGSAFFMYHNSYAYLITARHVLYSFSNRDSTWVFRNKSISIKSYPGDPSTSTANLLLLKPSYSDISNYCKFHNTKDIAAIQLGPTDTVYVRYHRFVEKSKPISSIYSVHSSWVTTYDSVQIGNEAFILGYPVSIGIRNDPQIDYTKPLLRKCVVAGKNDTIRTLILDCSVYPGNSGGPVFEHASHQSGGGPDKIFVIGVVTEFVPYVKKVITKQQKNSFIDISNSGYSVVVPVDYVLELLEEF